MKIPCKNCGLRYSSYCVGCKYKVHGLGIVKLKDEKGKRRRKCKSMND